MRYTIKGEAKGVQVQELWRWYTDFRSDDPQILEREGVRMGGLRTLYRKVTKEGDRIHIDQAIQRGKRQFEMSFDITLHPENMTYDVVIEAKRFLRDTRHYVFTQSQDGAEVEMSGVALPLTFMARLLLPLLRPRRGAQRVMDGYLRAAQKELAGQRTP